MAARRRDTGKDHFDLLPFIAILMCTLGCLLFVTLSIAVLSIGPGLREGWVPTRDRNSPAKTPILIEWNGKDAVIHYSDRLVSGAWSVATHHVELNGHDIEVSGEHQIGPEVMALLTLLQSNAGAWYALIAVRPSGFKTLQQFADDFRDRQIDVGYEPVAQRRQVQLMIPEGLPVPAPVPPQGPVPPQDPAPSVPLDDPSSADPIAPSPPVLRPEPYFSEPPPASPGPGYAPTFPTQPAPAPPLSDPNALPANTLPVPEPIPDAPSARAPEEPVNPFVHSPEAPVVGAGWSDGYRKATL